MLSRSKVKGFVYVILLGVIASATVFFIVDSSGQKVSAYEPPRVYEEIHLNDNSVIYISDTGFTRTRTTTTRCPHCAMALFREMESVLADYAYVPGKYFDRFTVDNGNGREEVACWDTTPPPYISGDTVNLYAEYNFEAYHIKFPGTSFSTINCSYGAPLTMPESPYENKFLLNWYITKYNSSSDVSMFKDTVLKSGAVPDLSPHEAATESTVDMTANLVDRYYTLTLDDDLGKKLTATVEYNCNYVLPTPTSTGRIFNGWFSGKNGTGTQYTNAQGTSLNKWTDASPVPLYADWDLIQYTITYSNAPGYTTKKYTVVDSFKLPIPEQYGYSFLDWEDSEMGIISSIAAGTTGDRLITAHWAGKKYLYDDLPSYNGSYYSKRIDYNDDNGGVAIIVISSYKNNSFQLFIGQTITKVTIIREGGNYLYDSWITTQASQYELNHLSLNLDDVKIAANTGQIAINLLRPTTLEIKGFCYLTGAHGTKDTNALEAIRTNKPLTIKMTPDSSLYVLGGKGYNGANGKSGTPGSNGSDGIYVDQRGKDGGKGGNGETGTDGKQGGMGINMYGNPLFYTPANNADCTIKGGTGGNGGRGGDGGRGGNGGNGAWGAFLSAAGAGGNGGNGGDGGRGGTSGAGGIPCDVSVPYEINSIFGDRGAGGSGGNGGNGGNAGLGGKYWTNDNYNSNGFVGRGGYGGEPGYGTPDGAEGRDGSNGYVPSRS